MQQWQAVVAEAELVDTLLRRRLGQPPEPSQSFTVHDYGVIHPDIFHYHPSQLYDLYGGDGAGCVYFFNSQIRGCGYQQGWKVAGGTQAVLDGGEEVAWKNTMVFHEGTRWLPRTRWALDELDAKLPNKYKEGLRFVTYDYDLCLYRLRRLVDA